MKKFLLTTTGLVLSFMLAVALTSCNVTKTTTTSVSTSKAGNSKVVTIQKNYESKKKDF